MFTFIIGIIFILAGLIVSVVASDLDRIIRTIILVLTVIVGLTCVVGSSTLYVKPSEGGIIVKKFGSSLKEGHIIAVNGERGVQAEVLSPGWSFGWWPWLYDCESLPNMNIPEGKVGVVVANDGQPLPVNEIYADAWESPNKMVDAMEFLTKGGKKGPQLTVLPPGQYRFNPKLFDISIAPCVDITIGEVGVVRANAGNVYKNTNTVSISGVQLVPKGYKGIWNEALLPGKYYLHPNAYQVVHKATIKKMYSYTGSEGTESHSKADRPHIDASIQTRSVDGFNIPVDVRVLTSVRAENAPWVVAKFGNPDAMSADGYETIETLSILPTIRTILRNAAQNEGAMQFVQKRSEVEKAAYMQFTSEMLKDKIDVEGVYLADIRLDSTPEGKALLKTQTDKQIADQQKAMYQQQVLAENERAKQVTAASAADQQKRIQESLAGIEFEKNGAEAARNKAIGEASAYKAKVEALGGVENFTKLEITKMMVEAMSKTWKGEVPNIVILGGGNGSGLNDVMTGVFSQQMQAQATQKK